MLYLAAALAALVLGVSPEVAERDLWDLSKSEERRAGAAAAVAVAVRKSNAVNGVINISPESPPRSPPRVFGGTEVQRGVYGKLAGV